VLSGQNKVYLIFYGTQWGTQSTDANGNLTFTGDSTGAAVKAQMMFKGIGTGAELWQADLTQWCDGAGVASGATSCPATGASYVPYQQNIFAGAWYDNSAASPSAATGTQLAQEAIKAAAHFGNTATGSNRYTYYVILSPHGTNPDNYQSPTQGYCAWHLPAWLRRCRSGRRSRLQQSAPTSMWAQAAVRISSTPVRPALDGYDDTRSSGTR
jgi:serine protease